jgi:two-component system, NarL family, sensor kinase
MGPTLAAIGLDVERVGVDLDAGVPVSSARLDEPAARLRGAVREIRTLVEGLRPAALDELGLQGAIGQLVRDLGGGPTVVTLVVDGHLDELPAAVDVAAYRIVSEALTNIVRHADATHGRVRLRRLPDRLEVTVEDDGAGLRPGASGGVGLASMSARAHELGGACVCSSIAPHGTRVEAVLPVGPP